MMQDKLLFEYAVIRVVPKVEREEFLNVGVILYCSKQKFLELSFKLDDARLQALNPALDVTDLREYIRAFELICSGGKEAGAIGMLPIAERFRWLTASRSTIVQTSKVHPGLCDDAKKMLDKLFSQLVLQA